MRSGQVSAWQWMVRMLVAGLLHLVIGPAAAEGAAEAPSPQPDLRVVIDVSGSMKTHDPDQLAATALELLVALLPSQSTAGVWAFGEKVDNLLPSGRVTEEWRRRALSLAPALRDYQQYTDIEAAVAQASAPVSKRPRHLLLLTDGMVDLPPGQGVKAEVDARSRRRLVDELAPRLAREGVTVHAIAFSAEADLALVEELARQTGGLASRVDSSDGLLGAFVDIAARIFPDDEVPLRDGRFSLDASVEEVSVLALHERDGTVTLVGPEGRRYRAEQPPEGSRWQVEPLFDLIRIPDPAAGEWRLEGALSPRSRVVVEGGWQLQTAALPATLYRGFPLDITAWLARPGDAEAAAPEDLSMVATLDATGREAESTPLTVDASGRFRGTLPGPLWLGNAELAIVARAESLVRQRRQAVNILPAIGMRRDADGRGVALVAEHPKLNRDNTHIQGELLGKTLTAEARAPRRWWLALPELDDALRRPLRLTARIELDGKRFEVALPTLWLNPEGGVGIDQAQLGPTLRAETLGSESAPTATEAEASAVADRFVAWINAAPGWLKAQWQQGFPTLRGLVERYRSSPAAWAVLAVGALAWLAFIRWRRRRRAARVVHRDVHREEPHV